MGADDKSILTKCGEILINLKTKNKKSKIYQFNCAYCNINCDKFGKFSKHIEQKHLKELTEESEYKPELCASESCLDIDRESEDKPIINVVQVKLEELVDDKSIDVLEGQINDDPLGTAMLPKNEDANDSIIDDIKIENYAVNDENMEMYNEDDDNDNDSNTDSGSADGTEIEAAKNSNNADSVKELKGGKSKKNFDQEVKEDCLPKVPRKYKKKKKMKDQKACIISESGVIIDENELNVAVLQAFEKQPKLWDVKTRTSDKVLMQKYYEIVNNEVNEKFKCNLTWKDTKIRLFRLRSDYTTELDKQRKGEECEIPWYAEHMQYLHENIELVLKGRYEISKYRPLKKMDPAELSSLIELFKKRESLWQVNNLGFGVGKKKDELYEEIRKEFNEIHNLNITPENVHRRILYMHRLYSKDKKMSLKCELENSDFVPTSPFYQEMSFLRDSQGPFKCSTCNEIIESYERYHIHVAKHENVMPFTCPQCQMGFKKFGKYVIHTRRHLGLHNYFCDVCGKGFPFKDEMEYHVTSHTGENLYLCPICGEGFRARHKYAEHKRRHENNYRHECEICKKVFYKTPLYKTHIKRHQNIRDFVCNICGKDYLTQKHLTRHSLTHTGIKKYECEICNKKFSQKVTLQNHHKVHMTCFSLNNC